MREAQRQLTICNACRYCEAYCAVFPAIELRTVFEKKDVSYIANLCHDCRSCFYACMYAPPHEFGVNIPQILSAVRLETYAEYAWPARFSRYLARGVQSTLAGSAVGAVAIAALALVAGDARSFLEGVTGPGSFYRILPYAVMVVTFLALGLYAIVALAGSFVTFWQATRGSILELFGADALLGAAKDIATLRYLGGGEEEGCRYPSENASQLRRIMHSLVFYGFLSSFVATVIAAIMQDLLDIMPPYPLQSPPVIFGSLGGIGMIAGSSVLIALKWRSDKRPALERMISWDYAFLVSLELVSLTGMLLLALRETPLLGPLMAIHLGTVAAFFVTMPYGKFVHLVYRGSALLQHRVETGRADEPRVESAQARPEKAAVL